MVIISTTFKEREVEAMETELGRSPLAHQEDCDCCCGCDTSAEGTEYPKDEEGEPVHRPL
jgi:hypothetical protein